MLLSCLPSLEKEFSEIIKKNKQTNKQTSMMATSTYIRTVFVIVAQILTLLNGNKNICAHGSSLLAVTPSLTRCVVDGSSANQKRQCQRKLQALLSIPPSNSDVDTQALEASVTCVKACRCLSSNPTPNTPIATTLPPDDDGNCPCADTTANVKPTCVTLQAPIRITVKKSHVTAVYPLRYVRAFNDGPTERVTITGGTSGEKRKCADGAHDDHPTCGWHYDPSTGQRTADSQGFCCECSASQGWSETWHGQHGDKTRANINCGFFQQGLYFSGVPGSAHCLYFSELWHQGYEAEAPFVRFTVNVNVNASGSHGMKTLALSPDNPTKVMDDGSVEARLKGDLAGYRSLPALQHKYVMVPFPKGMSPGDVLRTGTEAWTILDRDQVSVDGSQCDRVGTSFTAFRYQSGACERPVGACLANQIIDITKRDEQRVENGLAPLHKLSRYGATNASAWVNTAGTARLELGVVVPDAAESIVTLTIDADDLAYVVNRSPGRILDARVTGFGRAAIGTAPAGVFYFESMAGDGYLMVAVENTGTLAADFLVTASNCSAGVLKGSLLARPMSIGPGATELLGGSGDDGWRLRMATSAAGLHNCTVQLRDSLGVLIDEESVVFGTNATLFDTAPVHAGNAAAATGPNSPPGPPPDCKAKCPKLYNVVCHALHGCWERFFIIVAVMMLAVAIVGFMVRALLRAPCCIGKLAWRSAAYAVRDNSGVTTAAEVETKRREPPPPPPRKSFWRERRLSAKAPDPATRRAALRFLHLSTSGASKPAPFGVRMPGESYCLAVSALPEAGGFVVTLPAGREFQLIAWCSTRDSHVNLERAIPLCTGDRLWLTNVQAASLLDAPRRVCLN